MLEFLLGSFLSWINLEMWACFYSPPHLCKTSGSLMGGDWLGWALLWQVGKRINKYQVSHEYRRAKVVSACTPLQAVFAWKDVSWKACPQKTENNSIPRVIRQSKKTCHAVMCHSFASRVSAGLEGNQKLHRKCQESSLALQFLCQFRAFSLAQALCYTPMHQLKEGCKISRNLK